MRGHAIALTLGICLVGCNTGDISVTGSDHALPGVAFSKSHFSPSPSGLSSGASAEKESVFFDRVIQNQNGDLQSVLGISELGANSNSSAAVQGFSFTSPLDVSTLAAFSLGKGEMTAINPVGFMRSELVQTSISTRSSKVLFSFPRSATGFALSADGSRMAWSDSTGAVFFSELASTTASSPSQAIDLENSSAESLSFSQSTLLVKTSAGDAFVFDANGDSPKLLRKVSDIAASALSPDATRLACVKTDGTLLVATLSDQSETSIAKIEFSAIHDLSWPIDNELSYWVALSAGGQEVRVFDLASSSEKTAAPLTLPASVGDGVVCPVIGGKNGDILYFSNFSQARYVLEETQLGGSTKVFASPLPDAYDEGFICPQMLRSAP